MKIRVFISATSTDLRSYRQSASEHLSSDKLEVIVQDDLPPDHQTVREMLLDKLAPCDAVVILLGFAFGAEPVGRPENARRRSYTQMEFDLAAALSKPIYLFVARDDCALDAIPQEPEELQKLQSLHRRQLMSTDKLYYEFSTVEELCKQLSKVEFKPYRSPQRPQNLPYPSIGSLFKGREDFMTDLHCRLQNSQSAQVIMAKQAIHGLGGIGKTRLAVEYAWKHQADYRATLFVVADTKMNLSSNLSSLVNLLDLPEKEAIEEPLRVAAALRWLEANPGWLMILDNVDSPEAMSEVNQILPRLQNGHVLITSRQSNWTSTVDALGLDVLDEQTAVDFLMEKTQGKRKTSPTDEADARDLANELGGLALALEQAGAYISRMRRTTFADYLRRWREQQAKVREWFDENVMHYPRSVAVTWETSLEQISEAGIAMLKTLCWLDSEPIPEDLFDKDEDMEALADLTDYSMVKWDEDGMLIVHRLVQDVTRSRIAEDEKKACVERALNRVDDYPRGNPLEVRNWSKWEAIQSHVACVAGFADESGGEVTIRLLGGLATYYREKAMYRESEPLDRRALEITETIHGNDHPEFAKHLNNLGQLLQATNRFEEAEPLMRRAFQIDEQSFGEDHPKVAIRLNNLALLLHDTNRLGEAEPLMRRALAIDEQSFGTDHPNVARGLNNLAWLLKETNRFAEAEPLMRRALEIDEQSFGEDHPKVAIRLNNLALLLHDTNRLDEAEPLMRRAVVIFLRSLGAEHPNTQTVFRHWTILLKEMGLSDEEIQQRVTQHAQGAASSD